MKIPSNRYIVFAMQSYEASGGVNDIVFGFDRNKSVIDKLNSPKYRHLQESHFFQILDMETREVMKFSYYYELEKYCEQRKFEEKT